MFYIPIMFERCPMHGETAPSAESVISTLFAKGLCVVDASPQLNCGLVCSKFQELIDAKDINHPRLSPVSLPFMRADELPQYHQSLNNAENRVPLRFLGQEEKWRDIVPACQCQRAVASNTRDHSFYTLF